VGEFVTAGGSDFMVAQAGASDLSFSAVEEETVAALGRREDVARADGLALEITTLGANPYFFLYGFERGALAEQGLRVRAGRLPAEEDELAVGSAAASANDLGAGDAVVLEHRSFSVSGVYEVDDTLRNAGAVGLLDTIQALGSRPDVVTAVLVTVAAGEDPVAVAAAIERDYPALATIADVDDYGEVDQGVRLIDAVNLAISVLAVGIGAIGVMNTMIMSVFERTREIGILRAVGWRGSRIVRMVLLESLALCGIAAVVGIALGLLAIQAVLTIPTVAALLVPSYAPEVFLRAIGVGVVVALVGAAYPALRAVRLSPMEALRHE
jgi:putative ABC transport system permease protein